MTISSRIKKIRELNGLSQAAVAGLLNITQQAYSGLEQSADNAKLETLRRFCRVMEIDLCYLISEGMNITEETLNKYGKKGYCTVIEECEKKNELLKSTEAGPSNVLRFNTPN